ncbi:hypothetical protein VC83_03248 [Pseudogymnoascus destructans]|uniref:Uncharacterized protein n=2 Tax=Pseudogymnoascus destructans TaxID=655981 RepID=L8FYC8_PSED2|nr:uncharacterized protein VC83_03248 [Pseudogymnoascus destructans]ELR06015.1 hypothetical protein GMDG_07726 [Pseudogymnoascus destructans 20631-21]OAF60369.1 hypothetical protein VC83_03248 [Pseudogymnoascus destructans]
MDINDKKKTLDIVWHDVYDLDVKSGEYKAIKGKEYRGINAKTTGKAFKQEANLASDNVIRTGISGNDSTVTFEGIEATGKPQWVSFYPLHRSNYRPSLTSVSIYYKRNRPLRIIES